MSSPGQEIPGRKFLKDSRPQPPLPPGMPRKARSHSVSDNLDDHDDNETKSMQSNTSASEKPNVTQLRRKFEHLYANHEPRRPSMPHMAPPTSPFNSDSNGSPPATPNRLSNNPNRVTTTTRTTFVKPPVPPKARSSSPTPSTSSTTSESNVRPNAFVQDLVQRLSINDKSKSDSLDDSDTRTISNASSPIPEASSSSPLPSEHSTENTANHVRRIRERFDNGKHPHVYQGWSTTRSSQPTKPPKISTTDSTEVSSPPPPAVPPRPSSFSERYIKQHLDHWVPGSSLETTDSVMQDSTCSSNPNLSRSNSTDASFTDEEEDFHVDQNNKLRRCVEEVYSTEKSYVDVLYVLSTTVSKEVKNTCDKDDASIVTFNETYRPLLGSIQTIYKLHHDMILPQMEKYITEQVNGNIWTVLESNLNFIEKIYKDYYVKYDTIQTKLDDLCRTNTLINDAMLKCQVHLGNLYPTSQLNSPNQRLVRYILLMKTYMKHQDKSSEEYNHTRFVCDELDRIAIRCEEELVVSPNQLNDLNERLDNRFECIKQQRQLIWHGPLKKQSPRRHMEIAQRYMIVFSDCILVCNEESGRKLEIKRELTMKNLKVDVAETGRPLILPSNDNQQTNGDTYYSFRVNAVEKSYEFLIDKESERERWVKKIKQASDEFNKRNSSIEVRSNGLGNDEQKQQLGLRAPAWVNDKDVSRCQICNNRFRSFALARHHCRSCGRCICGSCSPKRLMLDYCKNEGEVRVCDHCYTHFTGTVLARSSVVWPKSTREVNHTVLFGDFRPLNSNSVQWIALQEDFQLHIYAAKLDQAEDFAIKLPDLLDLQFDPETRKFILKEGNKIHTFILELNHHLSYQKTEFLEEKIESFDNKVNFYANLWYEAIQAAQSSRLPDWYVRKRDSADSGVSNVS